MFMDTLAIYILFYVFDSMARTFVPEMVVAALDLGLSRIISVYDMEWDSYITNTSGTWLWK